MNNYSKPFGGFSIIIAGDFGQLPPVGNEKILYMPLQGYESRKEQDGYAAYNSIEAAFYLQKI